MVKDSNFDLWRDLVHNPKHWQDYRIPKFHGKVDPDRHTLAHMGPATYVQAMPSQPSKEKKRVKTLVIATLTKAFNLPDNREVSLDKINQKDLENRRKKYDSNAITLTFDERGGSRW
ncbi:hypothetical protein ACFE04_018864 [Oxalis oulophora]